MEPQPLFADLGRTGRAAWWRFALGAVLFVLTFVGLNLGLLAAAGWYGFSQGLTWKHIEDGSFIPLFESEFPMAALIVTLASTALLVPAFYPVVRWVHGRPWGSMLSGRTEFSWRLCALSFFVTFGLGLARISHEG